MWWKVMEQQKRRPIRSNEADKELFQINEVAPIEKGVK